MIHTKAPLQINHNIISMEYAVRGPIPQRAAQMRDEGRDIVFCNIGNPQALGQKPLSYYRQVLGLAEFPEILNKEIQKSTSNYPQEILDKASEFMQKSGTGTGAYTASNGFPFIRKSIAKFIDKRDTQKAKGIAKANADQIWLTNGASEGVKYILNLLITSSKDGVMVPVPQYPLYSATICQAGGSQVDYFPEEETDWSVNRDMLDASYKKAKSEGIHVKAIVVINPGNPTGAVSTWETLKTVIQFAAEKNICVLADEVYQENIFKGEFFSMAAVLGERTDVPLFSFHSISKGYYGECGHRGGYLEVRNPPEISGTEMSFVDVLNKLASVSLCPNTTGQLLTWLMVNPPSEGGEVWNQFEVERKGIMSALEYKANKILSAFTEMDGMSCHGGEGSLYLFPKLGKLPEGKTDFDYCMALLEKTGLCTVNGSGFGQKEGTQHLRIAFLPPSEMLDQILPAWIEFHNDYVSS